MDFARRQLEKYGWSDGKGLGKNENGISEALKPKLKRSVTGVGHDAAAEFNEHWWSTLYDKAAKNVEVKDKNGKTKKIKTVDNFNISTSTWKINRKPNSSEDNEYSDYFIKKATLTNDGTKLESEESGSESEGEKKDVFQMTDEELFKACKGRTAHKGARHGLKAIGKLARIAEQEQKLLAQTKYQGYSHAKKLQKSDEEIVETTSLADHEEEKPKSKKKKKKKRCSSNENYDLAESADVSMPNELKSRNGDTSEVNKDDCETKSKKSNEDVESSGNEISKKSKKKKKRQMEEDTINATEVVEAFEESIADVPKKKKKKKDRKCDDA